MDESRQEATGIAVIGYAGRFPGAPDVGAFWRNLRDGVESVSFFSEADSAAAGAETSQLTDPAYVRAGGDLEGVESFDADLFGYSPREAELMDPQHRLFLESSWAALENAGYAPRGCPGAVGVYAGASFNTYLLNNLHDGRPFLSSMSDLGTLIGNDKDFLATRVSYKLDLAGPSVAVQTACSTSLVAIAQACQGLLTYQCDMALAGGVSVRVPQRRGYVHEREGIFSPDGHCRAFDARAAGTVPGNGVGVVVLKRLDQALEDGDTVRAVVRGFAINNDGAAKVGYTAPSVQRQAEVIATAMAVAGIDPGSVSCVEAHGTGTALGDPIEVAALNAAFGGGDRARCALGSVKSNIGHLDAAAGVASFLKAVLSLENRQIPPSLHFERPNPAIDFESGPFYVNAALRDWPEQGGPRRAGVSSLGIGGTNAHVVLEQAPSADADQPSRPQQLIVLSARSADALERASARLADHLEAAEDASLADVAHTLQVGRRPMPYRRAVVCATAAEGASALRAADSRLEASLGEGTGRGVAFLFPGQGAQHPNMARGLYETEPEFRRHLDECTRLFEPLLGRDLRELLFPAAEEEATAARQLERTLLAQPALFVVGYSLARLWTSWGIRPVAMIGHSIGELVAGSLAGVFSLPGAVELIAARSKMMQGLPGGAMLAVEASADRLRGRLGDDLALAAVNAPALCVVSGPTPSLRELETALTGEGVTSRRLHTSHAFHSSMVDPILEAFAAAVREAKPEPPHLPIVSSLTGDWLTDEQATDPDYWARQMRQTVRFSRGLRRLVADADHALLEVGPGTTLGALARAHEGVPEVVSSLPHPAQKRSDPSQTLRALGQLWLAGIEPDWSGFYAHETRRRVPLPSYPFEPARHWVEPLNTAAPESEAPEPPAPPERQPDLADWFYVPSWRRTAPLEAPQSSTWERARSWLLVGAAEGIAGRLAEVLRERGQSVAIASPGRRFAWLGEGHWSLNPLSRADASELIRELTGSGGSPEHVLFVNAAEPSGRGDDSIDLPLYSLVSLVQALSESPEGPAVRLTVVTAGAHEVSGSEEIEPLRACVAGFSQSLRQETSQIDCHTVDLQLDAPDAVGLEQAVLERILVEAVAGDRESQVAHRGRHRWVAALARAPLRPLETPPTRLRAGGVYLITGGLGGVGLVFAEHLAREYRAKLVITGRRELPPREQWNEWLDSHPPDDATRGRIEAVRRLESLGAEVRLAAVDVADHEGMREMLEAVEVEVGKVNGVLHAAGVLEVQSLHELTPESVARVLRPKVQGTLALDRLFRSRELDFMALFSSLATVVGGAGLAVYGAANSFLDAYAVSRAARGDRRLLSIDWDAWRDGGMGRDMQTPLGIAKLESGISAEEGFEIFRRALESAAARLVISTRALEQGPDAPASLTSPAAPAAVPTPEAAAPEDAGPDRGDAAPPDETPEDEPRTALERELAERWQSLLGLERVGIHDNFFELGGHSLLATQFINRLRRDHPDADLSLRALFDAPTVAGLAQLITGAGEDTDASGSPPQLTRATLGTVPAGERQALLTEYLGRQLKEPESGDQPADGAWHDSPAAVAHMILVLERDLELRTYPNELRRCESVPELAEFVLAEIELQDASGAPSTEAPPSDDSAARESGPVQAEPSESGRQSPTSESAPKNESAIFVLSSPRSGSTLLRVMLSGHSRLFCPPELSLLAFRSMREWHRDEHVELQREGLVRALAALLGGDTGAAEDRVREMVERDLPTFEVYRELQQRAKPRKLLDKTPIYAYEAATLRRAEEQFELPVYLHLTRHPFAVIDSFVRARFSRLRGQDGDPFQIAERYWRRSNRNVLELARRIGRERCHLIQFEELIHDPEELLRRLCAFLDLPFEDAVLRPYEAGEMLAGPGDPKLFARGRIKSEKADRWKEVELPRPLSEESRELARDLGYEV